MLSRKFFADEHDARGRLVDRDSCMPKRLAVDADGDVDAMTAEACWGEVWPSIRRHLAGTMYVPISITTPPLAMSLVIQFQRSGGASDCM